MQIRNHDRLSKWPPDWGGSYGKGDRFLIGDSEGIFKDARIVGRKLSLTVDFEGRDLLGEIESDDKELLRHVCDVLIKHANKPLREIGNLDIGD